MSKKARNEFCINSYNKSLDSKCKSREGIIKRFKYDDTLKK
jgi:hypothetical protein